MDHITHVVNEQWRNKNPAKNHCRISSFAPVLLLRVSRLQTSRTETSMATDTLTLDSTNVR